MNPNKRIARNQYIRRIKNEVNNTNNLNEKILNSPQGNKEKLNYLSDDYGKGYSYYKNVQVKNKNEYITPHYNSHQNTISHDNDYPDIYLNTEEKINASNYNHNILEDDKLIKKSKTNFNTYRTPANQNYIKYKIKSNSNDKTSMLSSPHSFYNSNANDEIRGGFRSDEEIRKKKIYLQGDKTPYNQNQNNNNNNYDSDYYNNKIIQKNKYTNNNIVIGNEVNDIIYKYNHNIINHRRKNTPDLSNENFTEKKENNENNENLNQSNKKYKKLKRIFINNFYKNVHNRNHIPKPTTHKVNHNDALANDFYLNEKIKTEIKDRRTRKIYDEKLMNYFKLDNSSIDAKSAEKRKKELIDQNNINSEKTKYINKSERNNYKYNSYIINRKEKRYNNQFNTENFEKKEINPNILNGRFEQNNNKNYLNEINNNRKSIKDKNKSVDTNEKLRIDDINDLNKIYNIKKSGTNIKCNSKKNIHKEKIEKANTFYKSISSDLEEKKNKNKKINYIFTNQNYKTYISNQERRNKTIPAIPIPKSKMNNLNMNNQKINENYKKSSENKKEKKMEICNVSNINISGKGRKFSKNHNIIIIINNNEKKSPKVTPKLLNSPNRNIKNKNMIIPRKKENIQNNRNNRKNLIKNKTYENLKNNKLNINNDINTDIINQDKEIDIYKRINNKINEEKIKDINQTHNIFLENHDINDINNITNNININKNINNNIDYNENNDINRKNKITIKNNNYIINLNTNNINNNNNDKNNNNIDVNDNDNINKISKKEEIIAKCIPQKTINITIERANKENIDDNQPLDSDQVEKTEEQNNIEKLNSNIDKKPDYNNNDFDNEKNDVIKPVIQHKIERKRPVYTLPPSKKRSVSQGKPFHLINKYYDENFILEDDEEENIKLNDDSFEDDKNNNKNLDIHNKKNNLNIMFNKYLDKIKNENKIGENINIDNQIKEEEE